MGTCVKVQKKKRFAVKTGPKRQVHYIVKNLKKAFSLFIFKSLKTRVAAIGPRGCNRFYSGTSTFSKFFILTCVFSYVLILEQFNDIILLHNNVFYMFVLHFVW